MAKLQHSLQMKRDRQLNELKSEVKQLRVENDLLKKDNRLMSVQLEQAERQFERERAA